MICLKNKLCSLRQNALNQHRINKSTTLSLSVKADSDELKWQLQRQELHKNVDANARYKVLRIKNVFSFSPQPHAERF